MAGTELANFLVSLSENPQQAQAFKENPESYINASNLSAENKKALLDGKDGILAAVQEATGEDKKTPITISITLSI
ncbi:hypothetical protein ACWCXH_38945 [Kitasatospora sp. NPDC001660]